MASTTRPAAILETYVTTRTNAGALALQSLRRARHGEFQSTPRRGAPERASLRTARWPRFPSLLYSRAWLARDYRRAKGPHRTVIACASWWRSCPTSADARALPASTDASSGARRDAPPTDLPALPRRSRRQRGYLEALEEGRPPWRGRPGGARIKKLDTGLRGRYGAAPWPTRPEKAAMRSPAHRKRRPDSKEIATPHAEVSRKRNRRGRRGGAGTALAKRKPLRRRSEIRRPAIALRKAIAVRCGAARRIDSRPGASIRRAARRLTCRRGRDPTWSRNRIDGRQWSPRLRAAGKEKTGKKDGRHAARGLGLSAVSGAPPPASEMRRARDPANSVTGGPRQGVGAQQPRKAGAAPLRVIQDRRSVLEARERRWQTHPNLAAPGNRDTWSSARDLSSRGDGEKAKNSKGPQWFFREAGKRLRRSEFVALTTKD